MKLYIALMHHPVYNKTGEIVTTSITGFDLHDIARSALTYGVSGYYVVNPVEAQLKFAGRIAGCWRQNESFDFNPTRAEAFEILKLATSLDEVIRDIERECGTRPRVIATSARAKDGMPYSRLGPEIRDSEMPHLIIFGTGWGLAKEVLDSADGVLEPIVGQADYRHLSVRSAVAIILDRLLGRKEN